jgi:uncharacterized protein
MNEHVENPAPEPRLEPAAFGRRRLLLGAGHLALGGIALSACSSKIAKTTTTPTTTSAVATTTSTTAATPTSVTTTTGAIAIDRNKQLQSLYVPMKDGIKIAIDVWLPAAAKTGKVPTAIRATRYCRANRSETSDPKDNSNFAEAEQWMNRGYAVVIVDARGSGASFGTRRFELSEEETNDYGQVLDWIGAQPWSNGRVGSFGVSYDGDTADLMARTKNKHLVATAPQFNDFEAYRSPVFPGGVLVEGFTTPWLAITQTLDGMEGSVERTVAAGIEKAQAEQLFQNAAPVDGPDGEALLAAARKQHQTNARLDLMIPKQQDRDWEGWDALSLPKHRAAVEESNVAIFVQAGWFDALTTEGALQRFTTFANSQDVWLGPWSHAGVQALDPSKPGAAPAFTDVSLVEQFNRLVAFFDTYVRDGAKPGKTKTLRFTTIGKDGWTEVSSWPLAGSKDEVFAITDKGLSTAPGALAADIPTTDHTTGTTTRWLTQIGSEVDYSGWSSGKASRRSIAGEALTEPMHICGFPVVTVDVTSDEADGTIMAYLEQVAPDGATTYITEGVFRLAKRGKTQPKVRTDQPLDRSFSKADTVPMLPGTPSTVVFEMSPISALIPAGHRLQLSFASSDVGNLARLAAPTSKLALSSSTASPAQLALPTVPVT